MTLLISWCLVWGLLAVIPASVAKGKGRDFGRWWIYGFLVWPVALIHALVAAPDHAILERRAGNQALAAGNLKCPSCAEWIKRDARVCRFCGRDVEPAKAVSAHWSPTMPAASGEMTANEREMQKNGQL